MTHDAHVRTRPNGMVAAARTQWRPGAHQACGLDAGAPLQETCHYDRVGRRSVSVADRREENGSGTLRVGQGV